MDAVAICTIQGVHCYIKLFYGRLSSILNNFDREKTVTFSVLIREICNGVGTEYLIRSASNRSVEMPLFTVSTSQLYSVRSECFIFILPRSGAGRSRYPRVGKLTDYCGVFFYFFIFFFSHITFQLLDKPWSQVSSLLPPGSCLEILSRIGFNPTARRFYIECC